MGNDCDCGEWKRGTRVCPLMESPSVALKDLGGSSLWWGSRFRFGCQKAVLSFAIQNVVCGPTALLIHTEPGTLGESCTLGPWWHSASEGSAAERCTQ